MLHDIDATTERFHQVCDSLMAGAVLDEPRKGELQHILSVLLVIPPPDPSMISVQDIKRLRENEKRWSQRLATLMIRYEDSISKDEEATDLEEYVRTCPWRGLSEVARDFLLSKS